MRPALVPVMALVCCFVGLDANSGAGVAEEARTDSTAPLEAAAERLEVPPPPFTDGIFPCSECHEFLDVNRERRELSDMHEDILLQHDEQHRWCLDCHDATDRDSLHLASGQLISFEESYMLCGQCHGEKLRDWRAGVHGRRSGNWNGHKRYLLCAHCHNPHQPKFQPLKPLPAPLRPTRPEAGTTPEALP